MQADGFRRGVYRRAPASCDPDGVCRIGKLRAPAYGLSDARAVFRRTLIRYLVRSDNSRAHLGLKVQASSFRLRLYFIFRKIRWRAAVRGIVLGI